jgi:ubiquitin-protein ligase
MHESPRIRRLRNDLGALERLAAESSIFRFKATGNPPHHYSITFLGKGLCRDRGKIKFVHTHHIDIKLGVSYPRSLPELRWLTPIYHPNISEIGMICLGGYGTHWVPSVQLDELCQMLWDMARYHNYDIRSPYNRDAALWVANQTSILFPTDSRPLRDLRVAQGRITDHDGIRNGTALNGDGWMARRKAGRTPGIDAGADSGSLSAAERVRRFFEQYGRGRVGWPVSPPESAPVTEVHEAGEAPAPAAVVDAEQRDPALVTGPSQASGSESDSGAGTILSSEPASTPEAEDLFVLDTWSAPSPPPAHADAGSDEIIFLE